VPPIQFRLDPASGVPTYLQLVQQVEHALRLGYLVEGDQLPRVKDVVAELAINPNTVLKAYRELEYRGLAAGKPGRGTFVVGTLGEASTVDHEVVRREAARWIGQARAAGLDDDDIVALFTSVLTESRDAGQRLAVS
jgi:GntR family transcriptional regulator